jgi:hypothetical protein
MHVRENPPSQQSGRLGGTAIGATDDGDGSLRIFAQLVQAFGQLLQRQIAGDGQVSLLTQKIRGGAHVHNQQILIRIQTPLERFHIQHRPLPHLTDQTRKKGHGGKQSERDQPLLDQVFPPDHRLAPGVAEVGVCNCPG